MNYKDYYQILGVSRQADEKEIKKAYRRLARQYHPDMNPNDKAAADKFKDINEAYEVLSDPDKRSKYDRFGQDWQRYQQAGNAGGFNWGAWANNAQNPHTSYTNVEDLQDLFGGVGGFSDFYETLFGGLGGMRNPRPRKGSNLQQTVTITLTEAYHGSSRTVIKDGRDIDVKIPAGVKSGSKIRLSGEGIEGFGGGQRGDLYMVVEVMDDARFRRDGDDLYADFDLDLYTALLGGKVNIQTLSDVVSLTIPPETQNGRTFRLRGKGMPKLKSPSEYGDLYLKAVVQLPTHLTNEEKRLLEQLRSIRPD